MSTDRKIFFFDLDGTLLNSEKKITPATYAALKSWHDAGHFIAISSGRPMFSIEQVIRELSLDSFTPYCVAFNGCFIKRYGDDTPLLKYTISPDDMKLVAKCANDLDLYVHYYDNERILTPRADRELKYYTRVVKLPYMLTGPLPENIKSGSCKMLCIDLDQSGRQKILAKHITEGTGNRLCCMMSNPMYMEIFPSYAGKGPAVTKLLSLLDLKRENSFAAGDEENDISMLKSAGCGIVPANARAEVKASADLVCERDNDHDALTDIILGSL